MRIVYFFISRASIKVFSSTFFFAISYLTTVWMTLLQRYNWLYWIGNCNNSPMCKRHKEEELCSQQYFWILNWTHFRSTSSSLVFKIFILFSFHFILFYFTYTSYMEIFMKHPALSVNMGIGHPYWSLYFLAYVLCKETTAFYYYLFSEYICCWLCTGEKLIQIKYL